MVCKKMAKFLIILLLLTLDLLSVLSKPAEIETATKGPKRSPKKCMGFFAKPTQIKKEVVKECDKLYKATECARLCRLEKMRVIVDSKVNNKAWLSFTAHTFPTIVLQDLAAKFTACSPLYNVGKNASSSPDCVENKEFNKCVAGSVDNICNRPKPKY